MMTSSELICWGVIILLIYMICSYVFKVYKSLWKYIGLDELLRLSISNIIATAFIMIISMFYFGESSLISIEFIAGIFAVIMMSGLRVSYRLLRRIESNRNSKIQEKRVVIVGAGDAGNLLLKELSQNNSLNYKVVGFVDDLKENIMIGGYKILGTTEDLKVLKNKYQLEGALIAISHVHQKDLRRIYNACIESGLDTKIMNFQFKSDTKIII